MTLCLKECLNKNLLFFLKYFLTCTHFQYLPLPTLVNLLHQTNFDLLGSDWVLCKQEPDDDDDDGDDAAYDADYDAFEDSSDDDDHSDD